MALNQQQLEKTGIYEAKSPLSSLMSDLDQIGSIVQQAAVQQKRQAKNGRWMMLGGLIGAIVFGVVGLAPLAVLSILAIVGGLVWWIYSFFSGGKLVSHPMRMEVARQRLAMIQQDAGARAEFAFRLALSSDPKRLSQETWHGRKNGSQQFFEECWFTLEGRLLDGTVLSDEIKDLKRTRTFSTARGKRKTKTRMQHLVNIRLSYPPERYGDARAAGKALHGELKVPGSTVLRDVRVTEKAIVLKALVTVEKNILETVGMLSVGAYRILNLARRIAPAQPPSQEGKTK